MGCAGMNSCKRRTSMRLQRAAYGSPTPTHPHLYAFPRVLLSQRDDMCTPTAFGTMRCLIPARPTGGGIHCRQQTFRSKASESCTTVMMRTPQASIPNTSRCRSQVVSGGWASIQKKRTREHAWQLLGEYIGPGKAIPDYGEAVVQRTRQWFAGRAASGTIVHGVSILAWWHPLPIVVPQEYLDLYPADILPSVKLHPNDGNHRHPWVEKQNAWRTRK